MWQWVMWTNQWHRLTTRHGQVWIRACEYIISSCVCLYLLANSTSSVTHAEVSTIVSKATDVFGCNFQLRVNPKVLLHLREAWLLSANSRFWQIKHAVSRTGSATALMKTRLHCTSTLHFPKALTTSVAQTNRQGTSSRGILSVTLWQGALNTPRLCLPGSPHIYQTNVPPSSADICSFFLSGSIMHFDDNCSNPKMGEVMNSRGRDAFPEACFLRMGGLGLGLGFKCIRGQTLTRSDLGLIRQCVII